MRAPCSRPRARRMVPAMSESEIRAAMRAAFERAGVRPELIYAFDKTGRMVTEDNHHLLTAEDLAEWNAAIDEYRRLHP